MTETITGLLQAGLAQSGEPPLAIDRLGVTEKVLEAVPHSARFAAGDYAMQWLVTVDSGQLVPLLEQVSAAWVGSSTYLSWRPLGSSTPLSEVTAAPAAQPEQAPAAAQPSPGVLGSEPQAPTDLSTPPAGARNDSGFAH